MSRDALARYRRNFHEASCGTWENAFHLHNTLREVFFTVNVQKEYRDICNVGGDVQQERARAAPF